LFHYFKRQSLSQLYNICVVIENCNSEKSFQSVNDEHATVPRDPAPHTLSHEHSDVDTMESDSCQSSADAGDSQETGSVGDEAVAKGG
jgi:hypothetical protein